MLWSPLFLIHPFVVVPLSIGNTQNPSVTQSKTCNIQQSTSTPPKCDHTKRTRKCIPYILGASLRRNLLCSSMKTLHRNKDDNNILVQNYCTMLGVYSILPSQMSAVRGSGDITQLENPACDSTCQCRDRRPQRGPWARRRATPPTPASPSPRCWPTARCV